MRPLICLMPRTIRPCPARRATKPFTCLLTRSAWKPSGRCGSATNRTCSAGKRTTTLQEASATMFLYFLDKNKALFCDGRKRIEDSTLVALTIMIAESRAEEKEMMVSVVMNCM